MKLCFFAMLVHLRNNSRQKLKSKIFNGIIQFYSALPKLKYCEYQIFKYFEQAFVLNFLGQEWTAYHLIQTNVFQYKNRIPELKWRNCIT